MCSGDELIISNILHLYRYLVWLEVFLTNIDRSHPGAKELLQKGGIAVARSLIPGSLCAVDKTMEETFMRFAKSDGRLLECLTVTKIDSMIKTKCYYCGKTMCVTKNTIFSGGFIGLFSMYGAYQRWCRTTSIRAQYFEKMLEICDLIDDPDNSKAGKHRELERAEVKKSEEAVQRTISAIRNFTNPFSLVDKEHLYSLASGAPASPDVEFDVLRAEAAGKKSKEAFIQDRFVSGSSEELFFEPIKKLKLKTMDASNKTVKLTASQGKV